MPKEKRIWISFPYELLKKIDSIVEKENSNRKAFLEEAAIYYLLEKRKLSAKKRMIRGYQEMAEINLEIANEWVETDEDQYNNYELKLRELENR